MINMRHGNGKNLSMKEAIAVSKDCSKFLESPVVCGSQRVKACNFIIKRLRHSSFSVKFANCLSGTFFEEHLQTAASVVYNAPVGYLPAKLEKPRLCISQDYVCQDYVCQKNIYVFSNWIIWIDT